MADKELVLLKLGGSIITEKTQPNTPNMPVLNRLAAEIKAALDARGDSLGLIIGHGSGSFGHVAAQKYKTTQGDLGAESWLGLVEVVAAASRLNRIVMDALLAAGVPAVQFQPFASVRTRKSQLMYMETYSLKAVLNHGLVPVVYGDAAIDAVQGMNIVSTEKIFDNLARELNPERILLAGDVDGVYLGDPKTNPDAELVEDIDSSNWDEIAAALGGSQATDVTGGMFTKVRDMYHLTLAMPPMQAMIFSGLEPGNVENALLGQVADFGTVIN